MDALFQAISPPRALQRGELYSTDLHYLASVLLLPTMLRLRGIGLVEDLAPGGIVQSEGDHKIHVINVHRNRLELDTTFDLDFNRDISMGPARPHGVVLLRAQE